MIDEIHITLGDSAGGIIKETIRPKPGNLLVGLDPLSDGRLPALTDLNEWQRIRNDYHRAIYSEIDVFYFEKNENDILLNTDKLKEVDKMILWLGSGLADQLFFVWIVQLFKLFSVDLKKLRVIQFYKAPYKGFEVISIGVLNSEQIIAHPSPISISKREIKYIDLVWNSLISSEPVVLMNILNRKSINPLPILYRSLKTLLGRFPDIRTGLTYWDNEVLQNTILHGPKAARIIGNTMGKNMDYIDWPGDHYLYYHLRHLGDNRLNRSLVKLTGNSPKMRETEVTLTEVGQKVLDGELNYVEINGIDEWVGGIHLQSQTNNIWYRDKDTLVKK